MWQEIGDLQHDCMDSRRLPVPCRVCGANTAITQRWHPLQFIRWASLTGREANQRQLVQVDASCGNCGGWWASVPSLHDTATKIMHPVRILFPSFPSSLSPSPFLSLSIHLSVYNTLRSYVRGRTFEASHKQVCVDNTTFVMFTHITWLQRLLSVAAANSLICTLIMMLKLTNYHPIHQHHSSYLSQSEIKLSL